MNDFRFFLIAAAIAISVMFMSAAYVGSKRIEMQKLIIELGIKTCIEDVE